MFATLGRLTTHVANRHVQCHITIGMCYLHSMSKIASRAKDRIGILVKPYPSIMNTIALARLNTVAIIGKLERLALSGCKH